MLVQHEHVERNTATGGKMDNKALEQRLNEEVLEFIRDRRSLQIASVDQDGVPFASYAPFAADDRSFYVVLSDIAVHGKNLLQESRGSVLLIEDEDAAEELFARRRVSYQIRAEAPEVDSAEWSTGVELLEERLGKMPRMLSELDDFRVFRLHPVSGRYVKGFGAAYALAGGLLGQASVDHLTDGHRSRRKSGKNSSESNGEKNESHDIEANRKQNDSHQAA
ncbi:MAG: pyridoxamine 5'-phosphate oxidase family protein [Pseudomonadota bacterium]